ncbi:MAG: HAMP domain-containing sensor histidine kinase [Putridiphycobacter sp.]|nr:HAMP domain-containing sensor histidine kinase [Putridiphycobacter sp.]
MKNKNRLKFGITLALGLALWLTGYFLYHFVAVSKFSNVEVQKLQKIVQKKGDDLSQSIAHFDMPSELNNHRAAWFKAANSFREKTGYDIFIYRNSDLLVWTDNSIPFPLTLDSDHNFNTVAKLDNGWYYVKQKTVKNYRFYATFLIKQEFSYENSDLTNRFAPEFETQLNAELKLIPGDFNVGDKQGKFLFSVHPNAETKSNPTSEIISFTCYLLAFFILLQLLISSSQLVLIKHPSLLFVFPIALVVLRFFSIKNHWFKGLSSFELFNPELFASSEFIPSLGDLIINVFIFYFLVNFLLRRTRDWFKRGDSKLKLVFFVLPLFLVSFLVAYEINHIIHALVYDSKINFNLELLFELNIYSYISIALIGFCFYAYFKLIQFLIIQLKKMKFDWNKLSLIWFLSSVVFVIIDQIKFSNSLLTSLWPVTLSGFLLWFEHKNVKFKFIHIISVLAFVSFYTAYILEDYTDRKEREVRKVYAEQIAKDNDPLTEYDYDLIEKKLTKDRFFDHYLTRDFDEAEFTEDIESKYFGGLKNKYDFEFHLFGPGKNKRSKPGAIPTVGYEKLDFIIRTNGVPSSINPNIFFIKTNTDKLSYLVNFPIEESDDTLGYLMVEFRSKKLPKEIGLPSVLLENEGFTKGDLKHYSIAKYVDRTLVSHSGEYDYPFVPTQWLGVMNMYSNSESYSHYVYAYDQNRITVISRKKTTAINAFTTFSYLLIFYGFILFIPSVSRFFVKNKISFKNLSLNFKFQSVLIGLILLTLVSFGIGAGTYVVQQYHQNSKSLIKEKAGSVQTELSHKFASDSEIGSDKAYLEYLLKKFSRVFVTDINLFDVDGSLLASSQPKIYSKGLISRKMNIEAFEALNLNKRSEFIHNENIGDLEFLSAYLPFVSAKGELLAYLNIQYISKQDELESQISGFLLAIINIMVLMLAISIFLAVIVSNRLTSPLKIIQSSLKGMKLGSKNSPISYKGKDEIGSLVQEYNEKVNELENFAAQLAKSERESAWREMAKQVAHEIKNPLTPMKLSIQHLNRSIKVADEDSELKLKRVSSSLIEQIDALTKIANEFSNFAKMPKAQEEEVNLVEILESTNAVFAESEGDYDLTLQNEIKGIAKVWADKNLCLRVFNNLIKNATQAIPSDQAGKILVKLMQKENSFIVSISDNGVGIDEDSKAKMFIPYFTTKSTGTGLGLAMSKQIIENMNGSIWFESTVGVGTTFFVSFPKIN